MPLRVSMSFEGLQSNMNEMYFTPQPPVIQDIYDEDHYCLARNSGFFTDGAANTNERADLERAPKTPYTLKGGRLKTIMVIIGIILVTLTIGGIVAYMVIRRQGIRIFSQYFLVCTFYFLHKKYMFSS